VKSFLSFLGWILLLVVIGAWLIFYNLKYLSLQQSLYRQQEEISMWTNQVQSLNTELEKFEAEPETAFFAVFTSDELFKGPESFEISEQGARALRGCVPELQKTTGLVEVTGHTDNSPVPKSFGPRFSSNWDYASAKAAAVVRTLEGWGIVSNRLVLRSFGSTRPRSDNNSIAGRVRNQRIEILVRK